MTLYIAKTYLNDQNNPVPNEPIIVPSSTSTKIYLLHNNASSVTIFSGLNSSGVQVTDFTVSNDTNSSWMQYIQFGNTAISLYSGQTLYGFYTSSGDQCDSQKLNSIESTLASLSNQINTLSTNASVALSIVSTTPANNATGVSPVGSVSMTTNKWLDENQNNCIKGYTDSNMTSLISGIVTQTGKKSYTWSPISNLNNSSLVYFKIPAGLVAVDATISATPYTWSFQIASDTPPYTVDSVVATGYSTSGVTVTATKTTIPTYWDVDDPTATITFDVYLDANSSPYGNYTWSQISAGIAVTGQSWVALDSHTAKIKTKAVTGGKTEYSSGVVSSAFIIPTITYPTVSSTSPANTSKIQTTSQPSIAVTFSQAMLSTTTSAFKMYPTTTDRTNNTNAIAGTVTQAGDGLSWTFVPTADLTYLSTYYPRITTSAQNSNGDSLQSNYDFSFVCGRGNYTVKPIIGYFYDSGGSGDVSLWNGISVKTYTDAGALIDYYGISITSAISSTYYCYGIFHNNSVVASSVARSVGQHKFEYRPLTGELLLDNTVIATNATAKRVSEITLWNGAGSNAYFDDITTEDFTDGFEASALDARWSVSVGGTNTLTTSIKNSGIKSLQTVASSGFYQISYFVPAK